MTRLVHHVLYYQQQIVAQIVAPAATSPQDIRTKALADFERVPICDRPHETPLERHAKILAAIVVQYPLGEP